jgi:endogenous inhibitor of DNA gyrase (YacG/DUF329 family)
LPMEPKPTRPLAIPMLPARRDAGCRLCGGVFLLSGKRGGTPVYCSDACRRSAFRAQQRVSHARHPRPKVALAARPCERCGAEFTPRPSTRGPRFCATACREEAYAVVTKSRRDAERHEIACAHCGAGFLVGPTSHRRRFCSNGCKRRYGFAKKYGAANYAPRPTVGITARLALFERDGWRCGICRAPIERHLKFPHPGSASLDHIIPLADGGDHEPANWQAAHLICNIEKGNLRRKRVA